VSITIGDPLARVDGPAKVTGNAKFAAEFPVRGLAHATQMMSTIASGRIAAMDTAQPERAPGVIAVITPKNALKLAKPERRLTVLQDDQVFIRISQSQWWWPKHWNRQSTPHLWCG
jgi:xanthine dehydrogenase YagR molybdenum-binding subunit